jgi:Domain of unknown function (DUF4845)
VSDPPVAARLVPAKLPAWRLFAALFIFGGMVVVLLLLAPVYLENLRLGWYVRDLVHAPGAAVTPDETLRSSVLARARQLDLTVNPGDVQITRAGNTLQVQVKYAVVKDFRLYQVDVHFHPGASAGPG